MGTEVWFRNPHDYIRELVEVGECNVAWDRGMLVKKHIDPIKHAELYFGNAFDWRVLAIGQQGTAEYTPGCTFDTPDAVYPTWAYGEDSTLLEEMIEFPIGEDEAACKDFTVTGDERPVKGQPHRVVITDVPDTRTSQGRSFIRYLKGLQEDYPECIIHLHGTYGYKIAFGMGFRAADVEPRTTAQKGRLHMPAGSILKYEELRKNPKWAAALGFSVSELEVPRNRCMFNIKSAIWAGKYYDQMFKFKTRGEGSGDYTSSDNDHVPAETREYKSRNFKEGDKLLCDTCSLQNNCKYFRSGAVCTVPGAEPVRLSKYFNTRNADDIIDGLSLVVAAGANRLERGMKTEEVLDEVDPEVSKMMNQVFDQGVKLAKLLEPGRFSTGAKVQVNVGPGGSAAVASADPRQLVAATIQALVQQGYPRDQITNEMIQGALQGMVNSDQATKAIQGTVISGEHNGGMEEDPS